MGRTTFALIFALLAILAPAAAFAQPAQPRDSCVSIITDAGGAGRQSGIDLQTLAAASGGKGISIRLVNVIDLTTFGLRVTTSPVLTANLATVAQNATGGAPMTTIVREGDSALSPGEGDLMFPSVGTIPVHPFYVAPGLFVTIWSATPDTGTQVVVCYAEIL